MSHVMDSPSNISGAQRSEIIDRDGKKIRQENGVTSVYEKQPFCLCLSCDVLVSATADDTTVKVDDPSGTTVADLDIFISTTDLLGGDAKVLKNFGMISSTYTGYYYK